MNRFLLDHCSSFALIKTRNEARWVNHASHWVVKFWKSNEREIDHRKRFTTFVGRSLVERNYQSRTSRCVARLPSIMLRSLTCCWVEVSRTSRKTIKKAASETQKLQISNQSEMWESRRVKRDASAANRVPLAGRERKTSFTTTKLNEKRKMWKIEISQLQSHFSLLKSTTSVVQELEPISRHDLCKWNGV